jgi:hypothetical protein
MLHFHLDLFVLTLQAFLIAGRVGYRSFNHRSTTEDLACPPRRVQVLEKSIYGYSKQYGQQ